MALSKTLTAVGGTIALSVALSACSDSDPSTRAFEPDHVHGLSQAPGGELLIATHDGLFALNGEGSPTPVNDRTTDLMGFTVDEDGTFFASGHPGEGEQGPSALGLITSTDGGATFEEVSLGGQVDFHSLSATTGAIYGVNGGTQLMRTADDGQTWDTMQLPEPVADIAVDPATETVLATSESGVLRSEDLGQSFEVAQGAPTLLLVDWSTDGTLVGIDPAGQVFSATDPDSWTPGAQIDRPQAMTVTADGTIYVATEKALLSSDDSGASFSTLSEW